jgi:hypothetical protein
MKRDITFKTLGVRVEYTYFPAEPPYKYDADLAGYPGSDDKVEISSVYIRVTNHTVSLTSFFEETGLIYALEEQLLKEIHEEND